jgi:predicted NBD/HSP70 family sugar kinase
VTVVSDSEPPLSAGELEVTRLLLMHGPASRAHLGGRLDVSPASMTRVARSLLERGVLVEGDSSALGPGRPARVLSANPSARKVLGCKLTGDTAYAVVCDLLGEVHAHAEAALPAPGPGGVVPVDGVVDVVATLARQLSQDGPLHAVGVSLGGIVRPDGVVQEGTFLGWRDVDLLTALRSRLDLPVIATNDVAALAREQLWFGAGRTHSTFAVITVGAGIGFGVVREGRVVDQLLDNGQLLAHSPVDGRGPRCDVGHRGCVSAYLAHDAIESRGSERFGRPMTLEDIVAAGDAGDRKARRLLADAGRALGHLTATLAGALQTDRVVLAGESVEVFTAGDAMQAAIDERMRTGPGNTAHYTLDISIETLSFQDWAQGAAVTGVQFVLSGR